MNIKIWVFAFTLSVTLIAMRGIIEIYFVEAVSIAFTNFIIGSFSYIVVYGLLKGEKK